MSISAVSSSHAVQAPKPAPVQSKPPAPVEHEAPKPAANNGRGNIIDKTA